MREKNIPSTVCKTVNGKPMQLRELLLFTLKYITIKQLFQGFLAPLLHVWPEKLVEERTLAVLLKRDGRITRSWVKDTPIWNNYVMYDCCYDCRNAQYMKEHKLEVQSMYYHAEEISCAVDTLLKCEVQDA